MKAKSNRAGEAGQAPRGETGAMPRCDACPKPRGDTCPMPRGGRGIALIAVLWTVMLLSVIAGSLLMLTRSGLGLSRNLVLSAQAQALAEGGVHLAINGLLDVNPETRWRADGRVYRVELEAGVLDIAVQGVGGLIDLNAAPPELIAGLLRGAGLDRNAAEALADRIVDWRDADDEARPAGAEQADYDAAALAVVVANRRFLTADEIQRIPGVTVDLYARIAPAVTIYNKRGSLNPLSAPRPVLLAVPGIGEVIADAIIEARGGDGSLENRRAVIALIPAEAQEYLKGRAARKYAITSRAEPPDGGIYVLDAVIELTRAGVQPWLVHSWAPGALYEADANDGDGGDEG